MKIIRLQFALAAALCSAIYLSSMSAQAQASQPATPRAATAPTSVPALVPYAGSAIGSDGKTLSGESSVTFQIYKDKQVGEPLWTATQTVTIRVKRPSETFLQTLAG